MTDQTPIPFDPEHDDLDGVLFRLWCRAASYPAGRPSLLQKLMGEETREDGHATPAAYRRALLRYAQAEGINLPMENRHD